MLKMGLTISHFQVSDKLVKYRVSARSFRAIPEPSGKSRDLSTRALPAYVIDVQSAGSSKQAGADWPSVLAKPKIICLKRHDCQRVLGVRSMCTKDSLCACKPFHHLHLECFIQNGYNSEAASEAYFNRYPERRQPNMSIFGRLKENLVEYGGFNKPRPKNYRIQDAEDVAINVVGMVVVNPSISSRQIEAESDLHDICEHDHQCYCGADCEDKIACIGRNCTCKPGHKPYRIRRCI
ncbi:hypothetical protein NQ318_017441, partial [Aromia moschata]